MEEVLKYKVIVSVIIPARNSLATIDRAITSALEQTEINSLEIIVIDDGSSDETASFISEKYPSIKLISTTGVGVSAARNAGLFISEGRYVAFLDADDEWKNGKLIRQINFLNCNPDYVLSACVAEYIDNKGHLLKIGKKKFDGVATNKLLHGNFIVTSSVVLRQSVIRQDHIYFNESLGFGEDWQMWLRLSLRGKFNVISIPFVRYTCYPSKKYELGFLTNSLQKMVESLKCDPRFISAFFTKEYLLNAIPALAGLSWIKQANGTRVAVIEALQVLRRHPKCFFQIIRKLL